MQDNLRPEAYEFHMLGKVCETVTRHTFLEWMPWWTPESGPGSSRSQMPGLTAKPLFSGSFPAENVCWGARLGTAPERFFWEATPVGIHPEIHKQPRNNRHLSGGVHFENHWTPHPGSSPEASQSCNRTPA